MKPAPCHPDKPHYSRGMCMTCYEAERRRTKPEKAAYMRDYLKKYKLLHPEKIAASAARRRTDPEKRERDALTKKRNAISRKYGLSPSDFGSRLASQGFACALCTKPLAEDDARVDHCHSSGKVRGLLCVKCNTGLGFLGDSETGLLRAIEYLRRAESDSARKTDLLAQPQPVK